MRNITLSVQDDLLKAGREYAREHHLSLNALVRQLLAKTALSSNKNGWLEECFSLMDKAHANSRGKKWTREDIYDV